MLRLVRPLPRPNSPLKLKFLDPSLYPVLRFALMGSAVVHSAFSNHPVSGWFCKKKATNKQTQMDIFLGFTKNSCFIRADNLTLQTYSTFNRSVATIFMFFITYLQKTSGLLTNDTAGFTRRLQPASLSYSSDRLFMYFWTQIPKSDEKWGKFSIFLSQHDLRKSPRPVKCCWDSVTQEAWDEYALLKMKQTVVSRSLESSKLWFEFSLKVLSLVLSLVQKRQIFLGPVKMQDWCQTSWCLDIHETRQSKDKFILLLLATFKVIHGSYSEIYVFMFSFIEEQQWRGINSIKEAVSVSRSVLLGSALQQALKLTLFMRPC